MAGQGIFIPQSIVSTNQAAQGEALDVLNIDAPQPKHSWWQTLIDVIIAIAAFAIAIWMPELIGFAFAL